MPQWVYASLGDSLSTDDYTGIEGGGAAALLFANHPMWPDYNGRDLLSSFPGAEHLDLAGNGATLSDVIRTQLPKLREQPADLITFAAGLEDLVGMIDAVLPGAGPFVDAAELSRAYNVVEDWFARAIRALGEVAGDATVLVTTMYDPSDGSGEVAGRPKWGEWLKFLQTMNDRIRTGAEAIGAHLVDIAPSFEGHGPHGAEPWLVPGTEPNARGAAAIRDSWWAKLVEIGRVRDHGPGGKAGA
jgi:lysophospholipase L1-like esterase